MIISAIVATGNNNSIGKDNKLLWHLPSDLKFFKSTTMGCPVIMGRKTYESIGRLLPGRRNLIVSRNVSYKVEGAEIFSNLQNAIAACNEPKIFIAGGGEIYKAALPVCNEVFRTLVKEKFEADTFFPDLEEVGFRKVWEECYEADEKNKYAYCFQRWER